MNKNPNYAKDKSFVLIWNQVLGAAPTCPSLVSLMQIGIMIKFWFNVSTRIFAFVCYMFIFYRT